jgi:CheY-like chemotaxis protein
MRMIPAATPMPSSHDSRPSTAGADVLVIDDDRDIRETLQEILEGEGYRVATARNGAEGLTSARQLRPCMILLDLFMPVMDGTEFRREQLADAALAEIPVVIVSAAAGLEERIAELRVAAHLEKPLDVEVLFDTVARYCR